MQNSEQMFGRSVFYKTPLYEYFCSRTAVGEEGLFVNAAEVFRAETAEALLLLDNRSNSTYSTNRAEALRGYIIKLLLYLGIMPKNSHFAAIARLIEIIAIRPELTLEYILNDFAVTHNTTVAAVARVIEKHLNIYNPQFTESVTRITGSQPITSKDVLCDLAVHARIKYNTESLNE